MKLFLPLVLLFSINLAITAQKKSEAFLQEAAEYVCSCYDDKIENGEAANAQMAVGTCMITFLEKDRARSEAALGPISYSDVSSMTRIGERLGVKMAVVCPESMLKLASGLSDEEAPAAKSEISGILKGVSFDSQIVEVTVEEGSGRPIKLYWLGYFPGSEILLSKNYIAGKKVTVTYENQDVFSGTAKEYITRRVIKELKIE